MGHRQAVLSAQGFVVRYDVLPRDRGAPGSTHCIATKDGIKYFAFTILPPEHPDHHKRIASIQESIPHMARIVGPFDDVVLLEKAPGQKLWEMDNAPDYAVTVEHQLIQFALATKKNNLIHGDLRPWNLFFDPDRGVQVIDWLYLSSFVNDLIGDPPRRADLIGEGKHYFKFHRDLVVERRFTDIDLEDARIIGKLVRGEIGRLSDAWPQADRRTWYPQWCKEH
jgi:Phosphotransferase enzyme family